MCDLPNSANIVCLYPSGHPWKDLKSPQDAKAPELRITDLAIRTDSGSEGPVLQSLVPALFMHLALDSH